MHAPVVITPTCTNATPAIARVCANPREGITRFCRVPRRAEKRSRRHIGGRERYDYGERECTLLSPKLFEGDRRCGAGNGGRCAGWMLIRKRCIRFRCLVRVDRCRRLVHRVDERGRSRGMRLWCGGRFLRHRSGGERGFGYHSREGSAARWFYGLLRRCHHGCADEDPESSRHRRQCRRVIRLDNDLHRRHMQQGYRTRLC